MDIQITDKATGIQVELPMLPESVSRKGSIRYQNYDTLRTGEVKLPNGTSLMTYSWDGTLPGEGRKKLSGVVKKGKWLPPEKIEKIFLNWQKKGTTLVLVVTETSINKEVTLSDFSAIFEGAYGDIKYDITFTEARSIDIREVLSGNKGEKADSKKNPRPAVSASKSYTIKAGDSLWTIAESKLGSGSRYMEIYNRNKKLIGSDPNLIRLGQILTIP